MSDILQSPGQLDMFGASHPDPPHNGTETSRIAAEMAKPNAAQQRELVFRFIVDNWPCSDHAIQEGLGLSGDSVRPRRWELAKAGRIVKDGRCITASNRPADTWKPAEVAGSVLDGSGQVSQVPGIPG